MRVRNDQQGDDSARKMERKSRYKHRRSENTLCGKYRVSNGDRLSLEL